jgi:hypothetical protein
MIEYILFVSHNIYLNKEQRYDLANGKTIKTIAVNTPVWFYQFNTSEPAKEMFCQYVLTNKKEDVFVYPTESGYKINIPQIPENYVKHKKMSDEKWRGMTLENQEEWYATHPNPINGNNLKNIEDGGAAYMRFPFDIKVRWKGKIVKQSHQVEIKDINSLMESLTI